MKDELLEGICFDLYIMHGFSFKKRSQHNWHDPRTDPTNTSNIESFVEIDRKVFSLWLIKSLTFTAEKLVLI